MKYYSIGTNLPYKKKRKINNDNEKSGFLVEVVNKIETRLVDIGSAIKCNVTFSGCYEASL